MEFIKPDEMEGIPVYRVMDRKGSILNKSQDPGVRAPMICDMIGWIANLESAYINTSFSTVFFAMYCFANSKPTILLYFTHCIRLSMPFWGTHSQKVCPLPNFI